MLVNRYSVITTIQEERFWYVRNLALGLVDFLGATEPPVLVEDLLKSPPSTLLDSISRKYDVGTIWQRILMNPIFDGRKIVVPHNLPPDERRYSIAREFIKEICYTEHGKQMGLPDFLNAYYWEIQDYFARVLLAPDPLVIDYRKRGEPFEHFARTFIIPPRIAAIRWDEPLLH
jgi:hypothetical protein